jgi:hypothetical protein
MFVYSSLQVGPPDEVEPPPLPPVPVEVLVLGVVVELELCDTEPPTPVAPPVEPVSSDEQPYDQASAASTAAAPKEECRSIMGEW